MKLGTTLACVLACVISNAAFAADHRPISVPTLEPCAEWMVPGQLCAYVPPTALPACDPTMTTGTACLWPDAEVLVLDTAGAHPGALVPSRQIAIVRGPLLVALPTNAVIVRHHVTYSDSWLACPQMVGLGEAVDVSYSTIPACAR